MRFGIDEISDSFLTAFDKKKVSLQFLGLIAALLCFILFSWVGNFISIPALGYIWWIFGGAIVYISLMLIHGMLSKMIYGEVTSGQKITLKEAFVFSKNNLASLLLSPVFFLAGILIILGIEYLIFMLGKMSAGAVIISLLTIPFVLLNVLVLFALILEILFIIEIIVVDECNSFSALKKLFEMIKKAPIQVLSGIGLMKLYGLIFAIIVGALFFAGAIITLSLFGVGSGFFAMLNATEVPYLSRGMQLAYNIFGVFISIILGFLISYLLVFIKSNTIQIYLSIKDKIK